MYLCAMQTPDTRQRILHEMFFDIRKNGYQGLRADKVIAEMDITKGALYHYFPNKQAIGCAVIEEMIRPNYLRFYQELDRWQGHPINKIQEHLRFLADKATDEDAGLGCPLNNLVQEMSPLDEDFRLRMCSIVDAMIHSMATALRRGQAAGQVRPDIATEDMAQFIFASTEGAYATAKVRKEARSFQSSMVILCSFLDGLRV